MILEYIFRPDIEILGFWFRFFSEKKLMKNGLGKKLWNHPLFIADLNTVIFIRIVNTVIVTIAPPMARDALTIIAHKLILFARWF